MHAYILQATTTIFGEEEEEKKLLLLLLLLLSLWNLFWPVSRKFGERKMCLERRRSENE